jgi:hypothetical protein
MSRCGLLFAMIALVLAGCAGSPPAKPAGPQEPLPKVGVAEVDLRLVEHINRFDTGEFAPTDHVATPTVTTTTGCPGGPPWGVLPKAVATVSGQDDPNAQSQDLEDWLLRNGWNFDLTTPIEQRVHTYPDGTRLLLEIPPATPQLTLVLTGPCSWPANRPGGPKPGRLTPLPAPVGPVTAGGDEMCVSPRNYVYNTDSPPYTGPGPHPIALIDLAGEPDSTSGSGPQHSVYPVLPGWEADQSQVQLVVCADVEQTSGGADQEVTCQYDQGPVTVDVVDATYRITVLAARTGAQVAAFTIAGTEPLKQNCPAAVETFDGSDLGPTVLRGIDAAAFRDDLAPLIENAR